MAEKSAISAALRRRLFIVKIDVPQKSGKNSKTILRLKVRKVRKIRYAAAGISRYRLINVAPITDLIPGAISCGVLLLWRYTVNRVQVF